MADPLVAHPIIQTVIAVWMVACGAVIGGTFMSIAHGNKKGWPWLALIAAVLGIALTINLLRPI